MATGLLGQTFTDGARINIKPMSVNAAYRGRRFNTKEHIQWEQLVLYSLPSIELPPPPYEIAFTFGLSSVNADGDNCIKIAQDVIAKKYGFNDKQIKRWLVEVIKVDKGKEFFEFHLNTLNNDAKRT